METWKGSVQHVRLDCARNKVDLQHLADLGPLLVVKSMKRGVGFQMTEQPAKVFFDVDSFQVILGCREDEARILVLELLAKGLVPFPRRAKPHLGHRLGIVPAAPRDGAPVFCRVRSPLHVDVGCRGLGGSARCRWMIVFVCDVQSWIVEVRKGPGRSRAEQRMRREGQPL